MTEPVPIKVGALVFGTFPSGNLGFGGRVLEVLQPQGQPPSYSIVSSMGTHNVFPATHVKRFTKQ